MMKAKNRKIMLITAVVIVVVLAIILAMLFTRCGDHSSATPDQAQVTQATSAATTVKETTAVKSSESETVDATAPTTSKTDPTASVKATEAKPSSSSSSKSDSSSSSSKPSSSGGSSSKPSSSSSSSSTSSKPSSGGGSSSSSSSSDPHAGKTYHEAVYEDVWVVDQEAYSYEEPVYEKRVYTICHVCGAEFDTSYDDSAFSAHNKAHALAGEGSGYHNETRNIQTGTKTVNVPEEGHWEKKLVKEAGWY